MLPSTQEEGPLAVRALTQELPMPQVVKAPQRPPREAVALAEGAEDVALAVLLGKTLLKKAEEERGVPEETGEETVALGIGAEEEMGEEAPVPVLIGSEDTPMEVGPCVVLTVELRKGADEGTTEEAPLPA